MPIRFTFLLLLISTFLTSCMIVPKLSDDERRLLDKPPAEVELKLNKFFPRALVWYEKVEAEILSKGRVLSESELVFARQLGIQQPERIRVAVLEEFPMPEDVELRSEAEKYGMGSPFEGGRTLGYAIMLKPQYANTLTVLTHEFVHVSQRERLGKNDFLRRYLTEMEMVGYSRSPLELEAYEKQF
ncbi:MAG: hypothetical protein PHN45_03805 [Methylococcales bacterium]|nr:hypothetical protein [Methylococcales bacterium]MDD5753860.1 hypothetical protein [Methylococcales bacterium]